MKKLLLAAVAGVAALAGVAAVAQTSFLLNNVVSINSDDLFQDVVHGFPTTQGHYVAATLLGNYGASQSGNNPENVLVGGDATTNLFQRGTTGSSVTTAAIYGGPDRWAYWSGASTAMTLSRDSAAADLSASFQYAFKMARTSGQTGVVQVCAMQEVESVNSYRFATTTAELDFHATTGANFSGASANMQAYIITGTGTDEGVAGTSSGAFGLNAGGGGSGGWTGQVNWAATVPLGGVSNNGRYTIAAPIPAGTTEIAAALCWTPVGTAGTNDYIAFAGIQLTTNSALTSLVKGNASGTATFVGANDTRAKAFSRRPQAIETELQQRYYYEIDESAAVTPVAPCAAVDTTHTNCLVQFPVTMRATPTVTLANGFASPTSTTQATLGACTTLTAATTVTSTVLNPLNVLVNCAATTIPAAGVASFLYSNNGTGKIKVAAEL